ncbi:hypothetical protein [Streptomyces sp. CAU 1734]|uniref:hypothetical protein n=1 Tax=Streptomyces sp. CAU 1734 TaxID=3140360 RepID=UPI003261A0ED
MPDISEILKKAKAREKSVFICLAGDLLAEADRLEKQLQETTEEFRADSLASANPAEKLSRELKAVREKMRKAEVEFRFRALGARAYSDLLAAHPGKEPGEGFDPDTFPQALVSACAVDPVMTPEQAGELFEVLNEGQRNTLMQGAYDVNNETASLPFSVTASGILGSLTGGK